MNLDGTLSDHTGYMDRAFGDIDKITAEVKKFIGRRKVDTLVGRGLSGALVVPHVARNLGLNFVIVRKPDERNHHGGLVVGTLGNNWLFLDDFVASGSTLSATRKGIELFVKQENEDALERWQMWGQFDGQPKPKNFTTTYKGYYQYEYGSGSWYK